MEKELFALLRLGLGNSVPEEENLADFIVLTEDGWRHVIDLAREQGVLGIVLDGIEKCHTDSTDYTETLPQVLRLEMIGEVLQIEQRNRQQMAVIDAVQRRWAEHGIRTMIMKGQAMGTYYPKPEHRSPGDIDCYLFSGERLSVIGYRLSVREGHTDSTDNTDGDGSGYRIGNEVARTFADKVDEGWYKHSQIFYGGQMIENHQYFVHTREGKSSKRLNQLLVELVNGERLSVIDGTGALLPPPMFNALFLTYHAMTHFLEEGLKLKQVLDWAMFLKKDGDKVDWEEFYRICDKFHLRRFADVMNTIAKQYFNVNVNDNKNENENENLDGENPYAEKVLRSTLYDKDYVFSSGEGGWKNRWHIVRNLWKYRWKYHQIYQHSIVRQLWWYATGYLFKTE